MMNRTEDFNHALEKAIQNILTRPPEEKCRDVDSDFKR